MHDKCWEIFQQYFLVKLFALTYLINEFLVDNFIRQYKWNQDLVEALEEAYEVVYPFQTRDRVRIGIETRNYYYKNHVCCI